MYLLIESLMNGTITMSQEFRLVQADNFKQAVRRVKGFLFEYSEINNERLYNTELKLLRNNDVEFSYYLKSENSSYCVIGNLLNEELKCI